MNIEEQINHLMKNLQMQIDENRAVHRSLEDLRWRVNKLCNHLHMQEPTAACCALHAGGYEECK